MLQSYTAIKQGGFFSSLFHKSNNTSRHEISAALIVQATCITWFITKLIGWRLWTTQRLFPLAPPFDFLKLPAEGHILLLAISLMLMMALVFYPTNKKLLLFLLLSEICSCLLDQTRWQPWQYQFVFIIFIAIINRNKKTTLLTAIAFVTVSTYIYSGIGKLNPGFLYLFWNKMFFNRFLHIDETTITQSWIYYSGYIIALIELLLGIGLAFFKTQKLCAWLLILMHVFILLMVGPFPFSIHYNKSVWPWNILMIIQLYLLFIYNNDLKIYTKEIFKGWNTVVVICWGILPAFNHTLGWWDNFLSSRLFAGNQPQMVLCIKDSNEIKQLRSFINTKDPYNLCNGAALVNLQKWSMKELKSPAYIEERVFNKIKNNWIKSHRGTSTKAVMFYYTGPDKIKIVQTE